MNLRKYSAALVLALALSGCAGFFGHKARENALLPALRSAWAGVEEDLDRGLADAVADGDLSTTQSALLKNDADVLEEAMKTGVEEAQDEAHSWPGLDPWAHRGVQDRVDDGEASVGAAESRHERIRNFAEALLTLNSTSSYAPVHGKEPLSSLVWW